MLDTLVKTQEYLNYIKKHYNNVQDAWKLIQSKLDGNGEFPFIYDDAKFFALDDQIKKHDMSKLSSEEFIHYRRYFYPTDIEKAYNYKTGIFDSNFKIAWNHHLNCNSHHWQTWTNLDYSGINGVFNVVHNFCDWVAMATEFNQPNMQYFEHNKKYIQLPPFAIELMYKINDLIV